VGDSVGGRGPPSEGDSVGVASTGNAVGDSVGGWGPPSEVFNY
jgi:hypothetical protein